MRSGNTVTHRGRGEDEHDDWEWWGFPPHICEEFKDAWLHAIKEETM